MVLQMEPKSSILWGFGEVGARIEINYENHQIVSGVNGKLFELTSAWQKNTHLNVLVFAADGTWRVELLPHAAGGLVEFEIIHVNCSIIPSSYFEQ
jgi:hypothetical protein